MYLVALGLTCVMWGLSLWCTNSLVVVCQLSSCGMWAALLYASRLLALFLRAGNFVVNVRDKVPALMQLIF